MKETLKNVSKEQQLESAARATLSKIGINDKLKGYDYLKQSIKKSILNKAI